MFRKATCAAVLLIVPFITACTPQQVANYLNKVNHDVKVAKVDSEFIVGAPAENGACRVTSKALVEYTRVIWYDDGSTQIVVELLPAFDGESSDLCNPDMRAGLVFLDEQLTCFDVDASGTVFQYMLAPSIFYNYQCPWSKNG